MSAENDQEFLGIVDVHGAERQRIKRIQEVSADPAARTLIALFEQHFSGSSNEETPLSEEDGEVLKAVSLHIAQMIVQAGLEGDVPAAGTIHSLLFNNQ